MTLQITVQSVQCNTNVLIVLALYWLCMALYGSCFCSCFWDLLGLLARHIAEEDFQMLRSKLFPNFLETNPAAQSYVTQSATRINFVAEKILGLSLEPRLISAVKSQNFTKPSHPSCESLDSLDSGMWSAVWPSNYIKLIRLCLFLPCDAMCHLPPGRICTVPRESWWRTGCTAVVAGSPAVDSCSEVYVPHIVFLFCTRPPPSPTTSSTYT